MADSPTDHPDGRPRTTTSAEIADFVRDFNASNQAHKDLWTRARQAGDAVRRGVHDRTLRNSGPGTLGAFIWPFRPNTRTAALLSRSKFSSPRSR